MNDSKSWIQILRDTKKGISLTIILTHDFESANVACWSWYIQYWDLINNQCISCIDPFDILLLFSVDLYRVGIIGRIELDKLRCPIGLNDWETPTSLELILSIIQTNEHKLVCRARYYLWCPHGIRISDRV